MSAVTTNDNFGFWMYVGFEEQFNISNFICELKTSSNVVRGNIYSWGNAFFTTHGIAGKIASSMGGWLYIQLLTDTNASKLVLSFTSSVESNSKIADIYIDGDYYQGRKITPIFIFNQDGAYTNDDSVEVYNYFKSNNVPFSICGYNNVATAEPLKSIYESGLLEVDTYSGGGGTSATQQVSMGETYTAKKTALETIMNGYDENHEPFMLGCQFHKVSPMIKRVADACGYKMYKGGTWGWYALHFQQIYDCDGIMQLSPTGCPSANTELDINDTASKSIVKIVNNTIACGSVCCIFTHDIYTSTPTSTGCRKEYIKYFIDKVVEARNQGKCLIMTPKEFYDNIKLLNI